VSSETCGLSGPRSDRDEQHEEGCVDDDERKNEGACVAE
jgi:hypothetical protein